MSVPTSQVPSAAIAAAGPVPAGSLVTGTLTVTVGVASATAGAVVPPLLTTSPTPTPTTKVATPTVNDVFHNGVMADFGCCAGTRWAIGSCCPNDRTCCCWNCDIQCSPVRVPRRDQSRHPAPL